MKEETEFMIFVDNKGIHDPRINLAIEEYLLKTMDVEKEPVLLFTLINLQSSLVKIKIL